MNRMFLEELWKEKCILEREFYKISSMEGIEIQMTVSIERNMIDERSIENIK